MNEARSTVRLNRFKLLLVAGVFVLPFIIAWIAFQAGWRPGTRSHGEPVLPQRNLSQARVVLDDGHTWAWRDPQAPRMTLVALVDGSCGKDCITTLTLLRNARITLNDKQDRLRLLYLGPALTGTAGNVLMRAWRHGRDVDAALAAFRPHQPGAVAALLVESNGTALVRYPAGFSPDGLKDDLHKVLH